MLSLLKKILFKFKINFRLSQRRLRILSELAGSDLTSGSRFQKILEVGCANGKDFVQFCSGNSDIHITGIDVDDYGLQQDNFNLMVADAEAIDFSDNHFDLTRSIGVLEHIQPIEKLAKVISEIDRVSKSYIIVVPSVSTLIEPHTASLLWQLRSKQRKKSYNFLNYYSDEAWLQFSGFSQAKTMRFFHFPFFISNLVIYKL